MSRYLFINFKILTFSQLLWCCSGVFYSGTHLTLVLIKAVIGRKQKYSIVSKWELLNFNQVQIFGSLKKVHRNLFSVGRKTNVLQKLRTVYKMQSTMLRLFDSHVSNVWLIAVGLVCDVFTHVDISLQDFNRNLDEKRGGGRFNFNPLDVLSWITDDI